MHYSQQEQSFLNIVARHSHLGYGHLLIIISREYYRKHGGGAFSVASGGKYLSSGPVVASPERQSFLRYVERNHGMGYGAMMQLITQLAVKRFGDMAHVSGECVGSLSITDRLDYVAGYNADPLFEPSVSAIPSRAPESVDQSLIVGLENASEELSDLYGQLVRQKMEIPLEVKVAMVAQREPTGELSLSETISVLGRGIAAASHLLGYAVGPKYEQVDPVLAKVAKILGDMFDQSDKDGQSAVLTDGQKRFYETERGTIAKVMQRFESEFPNYPD